MKVRILKDLTAYDPHLTIGSIGTAYEDRISHNDWGAEMVEVKVGGMEPIPIGWNVLEILDKVFWSKRERDIKQAYDIELGQGSRGGFKWLRFYSIDKFGNKRSYTTNIKHEAGKLLELVEEYEKQGLIRKIIK